MKTYIERLVSVIVPIYNVELYLEKCIDSILAQTYEQIEVILVDDGSSDGSGEICDRYREKDPRVIVIHQPNGGQSDARNAGIEAAAGEYLAFVDSDDYIDPHMIEALYTGIRRDDADIAITGHSVVRDGTVSSSPLPSEYYRLWDRTTALEKLIEDTVVHHYVMDKLYRHRLFDDGLRYPKGRIYEDIAVNYRLFLKADRICTVPGHYYYYQIRDGSTTGNMDDARWLKNCDDLILSMLEMSDTLREAGEYKLADLAWSKLLPVVYDTIRLGDLLEDTARSRKNRQILAEAKSLILRNPYVTKKDKRLYSFYADAGLRGKLFLKLNHQKNRIRGVRGN